MNKSAPGTDHRFFGRVVFLVICDALSVNLASVLALWLRYEFSWSAMLPDGFLDTLLTTAPYVTLMALAVFSLFHLYGNMWLYGSTREFFRIALGGASLTVIQYAFIAFLRLGIPRSFPFLEYLLLLPMLMASRYLYRYLRRVWRRRRRSQAARVTMLVGAGEAGRLILQDLQNSERSENRVVCVIDDDKAKHGMHLLGVKIVGGREDIPAAAEKYGVEDIIIAIPSASPAVRRDIIRVCQQVPHVDIRIVPGLFQLASGSVQMQPMRSVELHDLLGRPEIRVDLTEITSYISGKTVLVTGGGGSIGSELCRQIAERSPRCLVIFDIYENNAYAIEQELRWKYPQLDLAVLIGSVRDTERLETVFAKYRPNLVFHAAAHKHVPLMENSPAEAVKNNIFGTLHTAECASRFGAEKFVLVSTDKAVRPTNIMGASKRVCEMIIQAMSRISKTNYVAVRFGNVLGSNGSVVPLFKNQILRGGPVTVTHKDITRFFMTIPEAVSLILQAGAYATGGEIFVLDMGEPVRIDDLARNLIRLAGFEPDVDIRVEYTGLRPGEKLYEEILVDREHMEKTRNDLIYVEERTRVDLEELRKKLEDFGPLPDRKTKAELKAVMRRIVPEYREPDDVNAEVEAEKEREI